MGFNFAEEEINEMYNLYIVCLDKIHKETKRIADTLADFANELKYQPVVKLSIEAVKYYNEALKQDEIKAMEDWENSELSFTKVMEEMSAGDSAKNKSKQLEAQIEEEIQSWKGIEDSLTEIDTKNWKCDASDFENIKQEINRFIEELETMQNQYENDMENRKSENEIYVSIEPVVIQSISIVIAGFREGISGSFAELAQEFENKSNKVKGLGAATAQTTTAKAQSFVSSGASALKAKVKQILD